MAVTLPQGRQHFDTPTGAPGVGYRLYTYIPGTSTPKATYTDSTGSTPNTNPVIANALGDMAVYFDGSYDVVLRDASDVLVWGPERLENAADSLAEDLASTASASLGAGLSGFSQPLNYVAGTVGAFLNDNYVNALCYMTEAERQDVKTGAGLIDVGSKLDSATALALLTKRDLFMPNGMYKRTTSWAVPSKVGIRAEARGQPLATYDPANQYGHGVVVYIAANAAAITRTGSISYEPAKPIYGVAISSHRTNYPTSRGYVFDRVSGANLIECEVWGVGSDAITIGVTAGDVTGQNVIWDCYVNNAGGKAYNIRAKWTRGWGNKSDGCTHGAYFDASPQSDWQSFHHEGWTAYGVQFSNGSASSKLGVKGYIGNTAAGAYGVKVDSFSGNNNIVLENVEVQGGSTVGAVTLTGALVAATSGTLTVGFAGTTGSYMLCFSDGSRRTATLTNGNTAVSWTGAVTATSAVNYLSNPSFIAVDIGALAAGTKVVGGEFSQCPTGVSNTGTYSQVRGAVFYQNGVCIANNGGGSDSKFLFNSFDTTLGIDIDHIGGQSGIWANNNCSRGIKASNTGTAGNFGTNLVKDNKGFKTKSRGTTGSVASGTTVAHGLATGITPTNVDVTVASGTYTNLRVSAVDATNITVSWDGGASIQYFWRAEAACENQT